MSWSNLVILGTSVWPGRSRSSVDITWAVWFLKRVDTWKHLASIDGATAFLSVMERRAGRLAVVRAVEVAANKALDMEAGPRRQTLNILDTGEIKQLVQTAKN